MFNHKRSHFYRCHIYIIKPVSVFVNTYLSAMDKKDISQRVRAVREATHNQGWGKWDSWDKGLYVTTCAAHGLDMWSTHKFLQLRDDPIYGDDPPRERTDILGDNPDDITLALYWIGECVLTYAGAAIIPALLPEEYRGKARKAILTGSASVSIGYAHRNRAKFNLKLAEW